MNRHWARVRALLADVPESAKTLGLGVVARTRMIHNSIFLGDAGVDPAVLFAEGMALAERLEGPAPSVTLLFEYGGAQVMAGHMQEGLAHISESVAQADRSGDPFLRFISRGGYAVYLGPAGRLREALRIEEEFEALCGGDPGLGAEITGFSPYCVGLASRGLTMAWLGHPTDGLEVIERALEIARRRRDAEAGAYAHAMASTVYEMLGDAGSALRQGRQAVEMIEASANPTLRAFALCYLAWPTRSAGNGRRLRRSRSARSPSSAPAASVSWRKGTTSPCSRSHSSGRVRRRARSRPRRGPSLARGRWATGCTRSAPCWRGRTC